MKISIGAILPVGTIIHSMLSTTQFSTQYGANWVLADGRSVTGTLYASVTGNSTIPDMRGVVLRGKNNGGTLNPDGDVALGTYQSDAFASHVHSISHATANNITASQAAFNQNGASNNANDATTNATGGNETRMKNITVNIFIRIN